MTLVAKMRPISQMLNASPVFATKPLPPAVRANLLSHACVAANKGRISGSVTATVSSNAVNPGREHARSLCLAIRRGLRGGSLPVD
jgi:hypothetical protein